MATTLPPGTVSICCCGGCAFYNLFAVVELFMFQALYIDPSLPPASTPVRGYLHKTLTVVDSDNAAHSYFGEIWINRSNGDVTITETGDLALRDEFLFVYDNLSPASGPSLFVTIGNAMAQIDVTYRYTLGQAFGLLYNFNGTLAVDNEYDHTMMQEDIDGLLMLLSWTQVIAAVNAFSVAANVPPGYYCGLRIGWKAHGEDINQIFDAQPPWTTNAFDYLYVGTFFTRLWPSDGIGGAVIQPWQSVIGGNYLQQAPSVLNNIVESVIAMPVNGLAGVVMIASKGYVQQTGDWCDNLQVDDVVVGSPSLISNTFTAVHFSAGTEIQRPPFTFLDSADWHNNQHFYRLGKC